MKAGSWETATSRWSQVADRLSASFGGVTGKRTGQLVRYQPLQHGTFRMDMTWVTGRIAVGGGDLDSGQHGGGGAVGHNPHYRHADRIR